MPIALASLFIAALGGVAIPIIKMRRARHRISVGLELTDSSDGEAVALVTVRNLGRLMGVDDIDFNWKSPDLSQSTLIVTPTSGNGKGRGSLLRGLLADGEVRTWTYTLDVKSYEGPATFNVGATLTNGRFLCSNDADCSFGPVPEPAH